MAKKTTDEQDLVAKWQGRIALAEYHLDKHGNTDNRWTKAIKASAGDFESRNELGDEAIDVNEIHAIQETLLPPLWMNEPHITVRPTKARHKVGSKEVDNVRRAEVTEAELAYWFKELDVRGVVKRCVVDCENTNCGYAYIGYVKDKQEVEQDGERTEPDPAIQYKRPFLRRASPMSVLLPPGYPVLEESPWVALEFRKPLEDVQRRWPKTTKKLEATESLIADSKSGSQAIKPTLDEFLRSEDGKLVKYWQIWDKRTKKVYTLADGHDEMLDEGAWPVEVEGFPVMRMAFKEISDEYYGTPPVMYYYPQNVEKNAARTKLRQRFNRSKEVIFAAGDVPDEVVESYNNAEDGTIIKTNLSADEFRNSFLPSGVLQPDNNVLLYDAKISEDMRVTSGLGMEQKGGGDPNIDSATASANVEKWAQVRASSRGDIVRRFYLTIARKLWMILKQFPNEKRSRLIAGPVAGQMSELEYTTDELRGEFAFDLDLGSVMAETPQVRQVLALQRYNLMRADPLVDPTKLILDVLATQNVADPEERLMNLRNPDEELQMMLQGLPVEAHERDDHESHVAGHTVHGTELERQVDMLNQQTVGMPADDPRHAKLSSLSLALALLTSHINSHAREVQKIAGTSQREGKPMAENMLRGSMKAMRGSETAAEMGGQALTGPGETIQ